MNKILENERTNQPENVEENSPEIRDIFAKESFEVARAEKDTGHTEVLGIGWDRKSDILEVNQGKVL